MIAVAFAVLGLLDHAQRVPFSMPFNTHDKASKCFHPKFIDFNNELSLLVFFDPLGEVKHADLKVLNKVDMTIKIPKVVKVFSKGR